MAIKRSKKLLSKIYSIEFYGFTIWSTANIWKDCCLHVSFSFLLYVLFLTTYFKSYYSLAFILQNLTDI